jgi:hypothetical protein
VTIYIVGSEYPASVFHGGRITALRGVVADVGAAIAQCSSPEDFYIEWPLGRVERSGDLLNSTSVRRVFPSEHHTK